MTAPRTFELVRYRDPSGVSGTGVVAEGCLFTDGSVALRWRGENPATAVWPNLDSVLAVHGHDGATEVRWVSHQTASPAGDLDHPFGGRRATRVPLPYSDSVQLPNRNRGWAGARHLRSTGER